jgi:cardiolipin synthase
MQVRIEGPAVAAQQTGFAQNWLLTTGEIQGGHEFFPEIEPAGDVPIQTILSSPSGGATAAGTMYLVAVQCAAKYLYIANPYFIPDPRVIDMLARACRRGVTVKLMVAGKHNDTWWARQNGVASMAGSWRPVWRSTNIDQLCSIKKQWSWMESGQRWARRISTIVPSH